ncbi:DNA-binding transcriptional LysR family regulator [Kineococcus radiotolerans]|uniref:Transcriptional regulator, LysR family n=2 Tax=Kineococcus radiotolerans TaxID=131568 RepID=A6WF12_KINRD|nr:LysR family transcriptional regulator [Kineococcus radiotolerans]ABS05401.1 transcriptional regulator, LysR family [Kineococcus radiotolerans SRS30216 = ATCC BAA-149]MBB2902278.1 DNA-binding transcriptional LysR family regulator [Kineococcus radiotolerans]
MDVRQLTILRELSERGSLVAVARALHVTPSAVSQQLAALQRTCPTPLTEKRGRRLALTPAGEALAAAAVDVAAALDRAARAVGEHLDAPDAPVGVCAFHSAALAWFGPLLRELDGTPPLRCADEDVAQQDFPALVADYDVVIAHRPEAGAPWPAHRVRVVPLLTEPLHVALAADHPLARRDRLTVADVAGERWVSVHEGFPLAGALDVVAVAARRPLDVVHRINEVFVAAAVVATGDAVALLPARTTRPGPGVVLRPLADLGVNRRVDALLRPEALARRGVRTVLDALRTLAAGA